MRKKRFSGITFFTGLIVSVSFGVSQQCNAKSSNTENSFVKGLKKVKKRFIPGFNK